MLHIVKRVFWRSDISKISTWYQYNRLYAKFLDSKNQITMKQKSFQEGGIIFEVYGQLKNSLLNLECKARSLRPIKSNQKINNTSQALRNKFEKGWLESRQLSGTIIFLFN